MKIVIASSIILAFAGVCSARAPSLRRSDPDKRDGERMDLLIREIAESGGGEPTPPSRAHPGDAKSGGGDIPPDAIADTFCGCNTCTQEVWDSEPDWWGHHTCGWFVTALQTWGDDEASACKYLGRQFPGSPCGQFCDPSICNENVSDVA